MNPEVWGPGAWTFLHSITMYYPDNPTNEQKMNHKDFFENLQNILPCPTCSKHYYDNLKKYPLDEALESKDKLTKWLIDIHNEVNKKNNKRTYSYEEVIKIYDKKYSESKNNYGNKILIGIVIVLILYILINCR
mgnify:FL=1